MDGLLVLIATISSSRSTTAGRCSHLLIRLSEHGIDTVRLGVVCSITRLTIIPTPTPWRSSITASTTARSPGRPVTLTWKQIKLYMAHLTKYKKIQENNSGIQYAYSWLRMLVKSAANFSWVTHQSTQGKKVRHGTASKDYQQELCKSLKTWMNTTYGQTFLWMKRPAHAV